MQDPHVRKHALVQVPHMRVLHEGHPREYNQAEHSVYQRLRLEDGLHLDQLGLVVLHVLDECASGVVDAKDLLVDELLGEVLSEEGGVGGGGDVLGGEAEDVYDFSARLLVLRIIKERCSLRP